MGTFQTGFSFNKAITTSGAPLPGQDYVTGLCLYGTAPSAFPSAGYKQMFSVQDAINVGITPNSTDETQAVGDIALTGASGAGLTLIVKVQEPINPTNTATNPNLITICSYTTVAGDTTASTFATNLAAAINANQANNGGYTATASTSTVVLTARKGLGTFLNSGSPISVSGTAAADVTVTQFASGVASVYNNWYYHIAEYFRLSPNGVLWVSVTSAPSTAFTEVQTLQQNALGVLRQVGVYAPSRTVVSNAAADVAALQTIASTLESNKMPLSIVYAADMHSVSDLTTLPNLSVLNSNYVSINISQDGAGQGWALYEAYGKSITNIGALLGCISVAPVSQDFAQPVPTYNISNGSENNVIAFANNILFTSVSSTLQTQLDNYRYIYAGNYVGYTGTFFNDSHCANLSNTYYSYIEQNRTENKLERILYSSYLPYLKSQIQLNSDGTIFRPLVYSLQSVGNNALNVNMAGQISGVECIINPLQNVTTQGGLVVTVYFIQNAIARTITVNINSVNSLPSNQ